MDVRERLWATTKGSGLEREVGAMEELQEKVVRLEAKVKELEGKLERAERSDAEVLSLAKSWADYKTVLQDVPLFRPLDDSELMTVASKLQRHEYEDKTDIITVGDPGHAMFIVYAGGAAAMVKGVSVKEYKKGDFFGELSLFNDEPRRATVISQAIDGEKSVVLELQRDDFQVLKERCQDLFKQYNAEYSSRSSKLLAHRELISQVEMFKGLGKQAALRLAAQVRQVTFETGDALMHEGDEDGDEMFIVETGEVEVSIAKAGVVAQLGTGAAFGELALVTNEARKATITAVRPTTCLTLKKADFTAGALKDGEIGKVLKRQLAEYKRTAESKKREEQERQTQQVAADIASLRGSPAAQKL